MRGRPGRPHQVLARLAQTGRRSYHAHRRRFLRMLTFWGLIQFPSTRLGHYGTYLGEGLPGAHPGSQVSGRPSIMSTVWGVNNMGRNFGIITYAAFVGTPFFSYLYAFIAEQNARDGSVCIGTRCWSLTIWIAIGSTILACLTSGLMWRRWRGLC